MSKKQNLDAIGTAIAILRDIAGNLMSGQDVRVVEYMKSQMRLLQALEAKLADGSGGESERNLDIVLETEYENLDRMTPFDSENVAASVQKWQRLGVSFDGLVPAIPSDKGMSEK